MVNTLLKSLHTKFGLIIIPIISLVIGGIIGYSINVATVKKMRSESAQTQRVIFDLERDCQNNTHTDH